MKIHRLRGIRLVAVLTLGAALGAVAQAEAQSIPDEARLPDGSVALRDTMVLSVGQAERRALESNPELVATRRLRQVAEGRLRQAGVFRFNPEVRFESEQVGSGNAFVAYEAELSQEVEWAGQRGLRKRAAEHELAGTDAIVSEAERLTRWLAAGAFYEALGAQNRLELAEDILALNDRLVLTVADLLDAGSISLMEANLARIESGRAQTRVLEERRDANTALLALRRALGLPEGQAVRLSSDVPTPPEPSTLDPEALVRLAMAQRPDLGVVASRIDAGESFVSLARRQRIPNLRLSLPYDRLEGPGNGKLGLGVGISIPLWNRNQGTVQEFEADVARSRSQFEAVQIAIRTEVLDVYQRYLSAGEEEAISRTTVLAPARLNQGLLDEAFRSGKIDLSTLLLVRNALLDAELDYWDSWLEMRLEFVRLTAVTAEPLPNQ
jgi:outer membrane protein, heavy metal efflux system